MGTENMPKPSPAIADTVDELNAIAIGKKPPRRRSALKSSNCASHQFLAGPGSDGWSRNHDGKYGQSAAATIDADQPISFE
jgi:hypothetical protein